MHQIEHIEKFILNPIKPVLLPDFYSWTGNGKLKLVLKYRLQQDNIMFMKQRSSLLQKKKIQKRKKFPSQIKPTPMGLWCPFDKLQSKFDYYYVYLNLNKKPLKMVWLDCKANSKT